MCNCRNGHIKNGIYSPEIKRLKPGNISEYFKGGDIVHGVLVGKDDPRLDPVKGPLAPRPATQHIVVTDTEWDGINKNLQAHLQKQAANPGPPQFKKAERSGTGKNQGGPITVNMALGGLALGLLVLAIRKGNQKPVTVKV